MKKNTMMRLASALLVLVLLTTCAISGTFAKYTSSANASDSARVAYWGWGFDDEIEFDLFADNYTDVVSSDTTTPVNVIAPGTAKSTTFTFDYTPKTAGNRDLSGAAILAPEVDYNFDVDFEVNEATDYALLDANKNFVWTLQIGDATAQTFQLVSELQAAVRALDGAAGADGKVWAANTLPTNFYADDEPVEITIGWAWTFEGTETYEVDGEELTQDEYDTYMGNMVDLDEVDFVITVTATQVDTTPIA